MAIPTTGFVIRIVRLRVETRGSGSATRHRTVGRYECYLNGVLQTDPDLEGATVEPRGPGDNSQTGVANARRIEEGLYPLATHGFGGSKYHTFDYRNDQRPRPGVLVKDTSDRTAILIHRGVGFKATVGCINLTGSIADVNDDIGANTSFARMDAFIEFMKSNIAGFPANPGHDIPNGFLLIEGEP